MCYLSNIRSFARNINGLRFLLSQSHISVVALTKTWLNSNIDENSLLGSLCDAYDMLRRDRSTKRGSGVGLLVGKSLCPQLIFSETVDNSYEVLCADVIIGCESIRLVVVYRAPGCTKANSVQHLNR